jgi:hypothetical protein
MKIRILDVYLLIPLKIMKNIAETIQAIYKNLNRYKTESTIRCLEIPRKFVLEITFLYSDIKNEKEVLFSIDIFL